MSFIIREVKAKSVLTKSGIPGVDYCVNPYTGCFHGCKYCYATFMKRFTGHTEEWGNFVDVKINAPEILRKQLTRAKRGRVLLSSVTDAYQPVESKYRLTRQCLEALLAYGFPVDVLTKSPLVLRDIDLLRKFKDAEVGFTITTNDEKICRVFEPNAPSIKSRLHALKTLRDEGIQTYTFIGPALPMNPELLSEMINPCVDSVIIDRMNYPSKTVRIYERMHLTQWLEKGFVDGIIQRLRDGFGGKAVSVC